MAGDIPDFFNQQLVEEILRNKLKEEFTLIDHRISLVGGKGDNYSSIMCRIEAKIEQNNQKSEIKIVIKTLPAGKALEKYVREEHCFEKEAKMLSDCIPAMQKVLQQINETTPLAAEIYYSEITDKFIIAMEDLGVEGFAIAERSEGLNLQQCLKVVESLAAFHVSSMVCLKNHPEWAEFFSYIQWVDGQKESVSIGITDSLKTIIDDIDNWSEEKWSEKLKKLEPRLVSELEKCAKVNPNRPIVLNHGDLWTNNIMFRQNSKQELELRFVDLQLSWVNSPVFDLMYFLFTAPKREIRFQEMDTILRAYHSKFVKLAESLNQNVNYSFDELKNDMKEHLIFGFSMFIFIFPITVAPPKDALDTSKESESFVGNPIFRNKAFQKSLLEGLPYFEKEGLF